MNVSASHLVWCAVRCRQRRQFRKHLFPNPGEAQIVAVVAGKVGSVRIKVKPAPLASIDLPSKNQIVVGGAMRPNATARTSGGKPGPMRRSRGPQIIRQVAFVDAAGLVIGVKSGQANIAAVCERARATMAVEVSTNPVKTLSVEPRTSNSRTGDVVRFTARTSDGAGKAIDSCEVRWAAGGDGAMIEPDSAFVAEKPGAYVVSASVGDRQALASVIVTPRNAEDELKVVGRAPIKDFQVA